MTCDDLSDGAELRTRFCRIVPASRDPRPPATAVYKKKYIYIILVPAVSSSQSRRTVFKGFFFHRVTLQKYKKKEIPNASSTLVFRFSESPRPQMSIELEKEKKI